MRSLRISLPIILVFMLLLSACGGMNLFATPTPANTPTPTEEPMALRVNGQGIPLAEYQHELGLLRSAQKEAGITADDQSRQAQVLDDFIEQLLLSQAAAAGGHAVSDADLQQRITSLAARLGGMDKLEQWKAANGYGDAAFQRRLRRAVLAAWMGEQVAARAGTTADQVHARQIRVNDEGEARAVQAQLQAGTDFTALAAEYDPLIRGDLGWFPRGYLYQKAVEDAAFALQPGQVSPMIQTDIGFHFVMVIERDASHPLSPDALLFIQHQALDNWLAQKRSEAKIEILV
jgi:peptidyl-prolyl cis-trans isomerase C